MYQIIINCTMFGFILVVWGLYSIFPARKAMLASMLAGSMFLPNVGGWKLPILRNYDKFTAISFCVFLTMMIVDFKRVSKYRFSYIDLPMILWCICPFFSSVTNDLGVKDGFAEIMTQVIYWGLPYFIGRVYFTEPKDLLDILMALFIGGLILAPFCLVEIFHGPLFHAKIYGYFPHNYWEQIRFGGWRPTVFFMHGLWLGWFMSMATFAGLTMAAVNYPKAIWGIPTSFLAISLAVLNVFCKSTGALVILALGMGVLLSGRYRKLMILCLILFPGIYVCLRVTQVWDGSNLVAAAGMLGDGRSDSLQWRLNLENIIVERALKRPLFGWGGYNRSTEGTGAWTEGIWTMEMGRHGLLGVIAWLLVVILPTATCYFYTRNHFRKLQPYNATYVAAIIITPLWLIYALTVVDFSPYNPVILGAMAGVAATLALPVLKESQQVATSGNYRSQPIPALYRTALPQIKTK